ncbi:MAG: hypothetical protein JJT94_04975, partial [Bernardetiaceae bacterium]|nr:hypothetical protein [Bernardetiaceae bacterium]
MKNILMTWHYTTHGIAHLKHILSAFFKKNPELGIEKSLFSPLEMNRIFDKPNQKGFVFDKVIYITAPQEAFDKIANRRRYRKHILSDEVVLRAGLKEVWEALL